MPIHQLMWDKAQSLIAADCLAAYKAANPSRNSHGKRRARPYSVPRRSADLAAALGESNAEKVASIMMFQFHA